MAYKIDAEAFLALLNEVCDGRQIPRTELKAPLIQAMLDEHIETAVITICEDIMGGEAWPLYGSVGWGIINRQLLECAE